MNNLQRIINAPLVQLPEQLMTASDESCEFLYGQLVLAYLRGQTDQMKRWRAKIEHYRGREKMMLLTLADVRLHIRGLAVEPEDYRKLLVLIDTLEDDPTWRGEVAFVLALAYEVSGEDKSAEPWYAKAAADFRRAGIGNKSVRAKHNEVACKSRIDPTRRLLAELMECYHLAMEVDDYSTAGAALNNLSREYQLMQAPRIALKTAQRAVRLLREKAFGGYEYYLALCHRAHLYFDEGHSDLGRVDFEEAQVSSMPEIKEALACLTKMFPEQIKPRPSQPDHRVYTWDERLKIRLARLTQGNLTDKESQFIDIIAHKASTVHEIADLLYPDKAAVDVLENRVKQIIYRVRRKVPGLIGHGDGKYFIVDSITFDEQLA